ncbi:hypothetical protein OFEAOIEE_LOCUS5235 [Methylorubrum extorquens]
MRDPHGFRVGIAAPAVAAAMPGRIGPALLVEVALARQVVVDADQLGSGRVAQRVEGAGVDAACEEAHEPGMALVHPPAQEIETEPAPSVLVLCLLGQGRRAEGSADILGLDQAGIRPDGADRPHRLLGRAALVDHHAQEARLVAAVRIPMAVEAREARRRQRLVHRGKILDLRIVFGDPPGMAGEKVGIGRIEQARVARAAAVMGQPCDRPDAETVEMRQARIVPGPVAGVGIVGSDGLPQDREAQGADAEARHGVEILRAVPMPSFHHLIAKAVMDPDDAAFDTAPQFQHGLEPSPPGGGLVTS